MNTPKRTADFLFLGRRQEPLVPARWGDSCPKAQAAYRKERKAGLSSGRLQHMTAIESAVCAALGPECYRDGTAHISHIFLIKGMHTSGEMLSLSSVPKYKSTSSFMAYALGVTGLRHVPSGLC